MNQLLNKLERKYGKYAVPDLIKYVIVLYCAGAALGLIDNRIYYNYLSLNVEAVLHGQVWRLVTYLIEPYGFNTGMGFIVSILFFAIQVNLFFLFGRSLERAHHARPRRQLQAPRPSDGGKPFCAPYRFGHDPRCVDAQLPHHTPCAGAARCRTHG